MTITLTQNIRIAGSVVNAGTTGTYDPAFEADLVRRGAARYTVPPMTGATQPAFYGQTGDLLWADGRPRGVGGWGSEVAQQSLIRSVNPFSLAAVGPVGPALSIANPYGDNTEEVHPGVVYEPNGWRGYRYWMAYTPYPSGVSDFENPCVVVSQDGETWIVPPGVVNPLVSKPAGGYNADTHLFFSPTKDRLYLAYRERASGTNKVFVMHTEDGMVWTTPVAVISGVIGTQDYGSPSIWWNGSQWVMVAHNLDAAAPWPVQRYTTAGADIYAGFGSQATVTVPAGSGRAWWHTFHVRQPDGSILALLQDNAQSTGGQGQAFWGLSTDDGATYTTRLASPEFNRYRCAFVVKPGEDGDPVVEAFLGVGTTSINRQVFKESKATYRRQTASVLGGVLAAAAIPLPGKLWADTFIRGDSTSLPGTATSGGSYTVDTGTFGISTNRLYNVGTGNNRLFAALGKADHSVEFELQTLGNGDVYLWFRTADASNFWRFGRRSADGALVLQSFVSGAQATIDTLLSVVVAAGSRLRVDAAGARCRCFVDDVMVFDRSMASTLAATIGGVQLTGTSPSYVRNFVAVDLS